MLKRIFNTYLYFILTVYLVVSIFRIMEVSVVLHNFGYDWSTLSSEIYGLFRDLLAANILLLLYFPFYILFVKLSQNLDKIIGISILTLLSIANFFILRYFFYQFSLLDTFLYQYSPKEIIFTINTSNVSPWLNIIILLVLLLITSFFMWKIKKQTFSPNTHKLIVFLMLVSLPTYFLLNTLYPNKIDRFSRNKGRYFMLQSFKYFFEKDMQNQKDYNVKDFHKLYSEKKFLSEKYPLVYQANRKDSLGSYFQKFDKPPNIVVLIVEGLNDDFIHKYHGVQLMPFLQQLKNKSLYWNRCFTLGERSFAVVPCLLGGLPYGKIGFTLLENVPRHLSLVSVLKSNHYYTSYFDGQGAWFHKKSRFFKYNNIDLVFDKDKFSEKYNKVLAGNDHFFWGYNDKDLFNQSLEVLDTLPNKPLLNIYFTGTTHSPFTINNNKTDYSKRLVKLKTPSNSKFFDNYSTYLKTILFTDDALKEFIDKYQKRKDYENTIFIITGDHPMTELPRENSLKRYHVPMIIYSSKLKEAKTFTNIVSHLDFPETLLSFLQNYIPNIPTVSISLGTQLLPQKEVSRNIPFMNDNRQIIDFYSNGYYLAGKQLYKVDSALNIRAIRNQKREVILRERLNIFKKFSLSTSITDGIISDSLYSKELNKKILYSSKTLDTTKVNDKYYPLIKKIVIPNSKLSFDFQLKIDSKIDSGMSIVYRITNKNDSTLLWKNRGFENEKKITQYHIKIGKMNVPDSVLYFNSIIWNKNKVSMEITEIKLLLSTENSSKQSK